MEKGGTFESEGSVVLVFDDEALSATGEAVCAVSED